MTEPLVSFVAQATYDAAAVLGAVRAALAPLGGMENFVKPGQRVLLKPNLVYGRHPDRAVNPHPAVVEAAAVLAREAGASWLGMGDSPGFGSGRAAMKTAGLLDVADRHGLEIVEFTPYDDIVQGRSFVKLELARELREVDVVINLPKMKTHGQMLMTLAVKNMFGAVPGTRKFQWHYRAGRNRMMFARMINEIAVAARPHLNIMDAVVGMDKIGPSSGRARPVGFIAASADPWAMDAAIMDVLGVERTKLYTLADAQENGPREWQNLRTVGPSPESLRPRDWRLPRIHSLQMHGGTIDKYLPFLASWFRSRFTPPPAPLETCVACGYCVEICPAKAMRLENNKVVIDDASCIRCFCCHELCQYQAMGIKKPGLLAKLIGLTSD